MATTRKQKAGYWAAISMFIIIAVACVLLSFTEEKGSGAATQEIRLRKIGHELLLRSGDSTSRVLPIQKISDGVFQVKFEHEFGFRTDSLVSIVRRELQQDPGLTGYIVNVKACNSSDVLYGFAVSEKPQDNIMSCSGRNQPPGCYLVEIRLQNDSMVSLKRKDMIAGLSVLAFVGLLVASPFRIRRKRTVLPGEENAGILLGNTCYEPEKKQLTIAGISTELTPKENRLLKILADHKNEIVERSLLQKELWENEGVIVGRSLDVFISKLRKKLESDTTIELKNIHGKGYRLDCGGDQANQTL